MAQEVGHEVQRQERLLAILSAFSVAVPASLFPIQGLSDSRNSGQQDQMQGDQSIIRLAANCIADLAISRLQFADNRTAELLISRLQIIIDRTHEYRLRGIDSGRCDIRYHQR